MAENPLASDRRLRLWCTFAPAEFGPPAIAFRLADVDDIKRAVEGKGKGTVILRK